MEEFDEMFDNGEDIDHLIDWSRMRRPNLESRRVNVDFPNWMVRRLDAHAQKRGVTRQALIKMWLADRLEETAQAEDDKLIAAPLRAGSRAGWEVAAVEIAVHGDPDEADWQGFANEDDEKLKW